MNRRKYLKRGFALGGCLLLPAGALSLVGRTGMAQVSSPNSMSGRIMGTGYSVTLGAQTQSVNSLHQIVLNELSAVDNTMSTWRPESEISKFNRSVNLEWQSIPHAMMQVIQHGMQTSKNSKGAFDTTIAPLVNAWGFGANSLHSTGGFKKPSVSEINAATSQVGYQEIDLEFANNKLRKRKDYVQLDLSGIAKGFAVDKVAAVLDKHDIHDYLVEVGGELRSRGKNVNGKEWRVAIERPSDYQQSAFRIVSLPNRAIATSGDYRNFFLDGGVRYSHSIDPRSGVPVNHELASVTVVEKTTMAADSLSTAFMIMGPDEALDFANENGIAIHMILRSATGKLSEVHSAQMDSFLI